MELINRNSDEFLIIRNQTGFESHVSGNCHPDIDFSSYDLVIGKKQLTTGNNSIEYQLTENCETHHYTLGVTFHQNESTVAPNLTFHRLIPKFSEEEELSVEIKVEL